MKAILVIDIDDDLLDKFENFYVDYVLLGEDDYEIKSIRQERDCLLKPMPEKKRQNVDFVQRIGYNLCIDEILGESEKRRKK